MATNQDRHSYRLIDGMFLADEAKEMLMNLVQQKISFHQRNDLSRWERLGDTDPPGAKRIDELRSTMAELDTFLADADSRGMKLAIRCNIDITLEPQ